MAGIVGVTGLPGGGKTYSAVELFLIPALKEKRHIVHNLPLKIDNIKADFPDYPLERLKTIVIDEFEWDIKNLPPGSLLMLDEVWKLWPQGKQLKNIPVPEMVVLKEHRHHSDQQGRSMDIVLISQSVDDLSKPVRDLIETTVISIKHLDLGSENTAIRFFCKKACAVDKTGKPPNNQINRSENIKYNEKVYRYYKTHMHGQAAAGAGPNEKRSISSSLFGSFRFKAGVVIFLIAIFVTAKSALDTKENINKATTKKQPTQISQVEKISKTPEKKEIKTNYSDSWKIAGIFYNFGGTGHDRYILVNGSHQYRHIDGTKHCKIVEYEPVCEVDGHEVTFFSGSGSSGGGLLPPPQEIKGNL